MKNTIFKSFKFTFSFLSFPYKLDVTRRSLYLSFVKNLTSAHVIDSSDNISNKEIILR